MFWAADLSLCSNCSWHTPQGSGLHCNAMNGQWRRQLSFCHPVYYIVWMGIFIFLPRGCLHVTFFWKYNFWSTYLSNLNYSGLPKNVISDFTCLLSVHHSINYHSFRGERREVMVGGALLFNLLDEVKIQSCWSNEPTWSHPCRTGHAGRLPVLLMSLNLKLDHSLSMNTFRIKFNCSFDESEYIISKF